MTAKIQKVNNSIKSRKKTKQKKNKEKTDKRLMSIAVER